MILTTAAATAATRPLAPAARERTESWTASLSSITEWLASHYVEIILAILAAALIVTALLGIKALILRAAARMSGAHHWPLLIAQVVGRTRMWFLVALAARLVQGFSRPPEVIAQTVSFVFVIAAVLQVALWVRAFVLGLIETRASADGVDHSTLGSAIGIIRLLVSFAVFAIAAILILDNLGVNVTGLVAGLGIGGIAIGLAAQGIFSDLFAALSIIFDKPFRVGDVIAYQGKEGSVVGIVEKIGLKSTRVRALTGELRIIGNTQLLGQELTNFAGRSNYRHHVAIGIIYQTDPAVAAAIPKMLREAVEHGGQTFIRSNFVRFGASSLDYELLFESKAASLEEANLGLEAVAFEILRRFKREGIEFAYPTQTTFTAAPDGHMILPYPEHAVAVVGERSRSEPSP